MRRARKTSLSSVSFPLEASMENELMEPLWLLS